MAKIRIYKLKCVWMKTIVKFISIQDPKNIIQKSLFTLTQTL